MLVCIFSELHIELKIKKKLRDSAFFPAFSKNAFVLFRFEQLIDLSLALMVNSVCT